MKDQAKRSPALTCSAAKSSFFVNWKGDLTPCPLFVVPVTKPLEIGFKEAWDALRDKALAITISDKCKSCDKRIFCPVCPPRLYLETGSFEEHSEYLCELAKGKENFVRRFYYIN